MPQEQNVPSLMVAVVGAGPSGYYAAETLAKLKAPGEIAIDILDRLPTPYGLIRAGVAPDHQSIKNVSARYEKTNALEHVRFVGNLSLGSDVTLSDLMDLYDAVILATGAGKDRMLGLQHEDLPGIYGSAQFVGWYNAHPDYKDLEPNLNVSSVAVIGNGNVALDVARVLAKTAEEMAGSDLAAHAEAPIHSSPVRDIHILGRRGPMDASFTPKELTEMTKLVNAESVIDATTLPAGDDGLSTVQIKNLKAYRQMRDSAAPDRLKPLRVHLHSYRRPVAFIGDGALDAIRVEKTRLTEGRVAGTGEMLDIPVGLAVTCIGYKSAPLEDVPYDRRHGHFSNEEGLIRPRLYCTGWARRGPTGTIGTNKPDAADVSNRILAEVTPSGKPGRTGLDALATERGLKLVTFRDWKKIEALEEERAEGDHPRAKLADIDAMLEAVDTDTAS